MKKLLTLLLLLVTTTTFAKNPLTDALNKQRDDDAEILRGNFGRMVLPDDGKFTIDDYKQKYSELINMRGQIIRKTNKINREHKDDKKYKNVIKKLFFTDKESDLISTPIQKKEDGRLTLIGPREYLFEEHYTPDVKAINTLIKKIEQKEKIVRQNRDYLYTVDSDIYNLELDFLQVCKEALYLLKDLKY